MFELAMDLNPSQYTEADRRAVDPPIPVDTATWAHAGQLDWWVKERRPRLEWFGRVRGSDGKQRWIRASDLRPANGSQP
jgi:hypothetical protein